MQTVTIPTFDILPGYAFFGLVNDSAILLDTTLENILLAIGDTNSLLTDIKNKLNSTVDVNVTNAQVTVNNNGTFAP